MQFAVITVVDPDTCDAVAQPSAKQQMIQLGVLRDAVIPAAAAAGNKTVVFFSHMYIYMMVLPRQARDKHRENSKKDCFAAAETSLFCLNVFCRDFCVVVPSLSWQLLGFQSGKSRAPKMRLCTGCSPPAAS
jgi:hypothetical protein